jgi:hypothetical protein
LQELRLLALLAMHKGIFGYRDIIEELWGDYKNGGVLNTKGHVARIAPQPSQTPRPSRMGNSHRETIITPAAGSR